MGCGSPSSYKKAPAVSNPVPKSTVIQSGPISDPILQKKLDSITRITEWYNKSNAYLTTHISLGESILNKLDKKIKLTSKGVEDLIEFFHERANREEDYAKQKSALKSCFKEDTGNMYPNLNKLLEEIDNYHLNKAKSVANLAKYIENDIIKGIFKKSLSDFQKKMESYKEKILDLKKAVKHLHEEAQGKFQKYSKLYESFVLAFQDPAAEKPSRKDDFYMFELAFIKAMKDAQEKAKTSLGKLINEYWAESKLSKTALLDSLKNGLTSYLTKTNEVHGETATEGGQQIISLKSAVGLLEAFVPGAEILTHFDIGKICEELGAIENIKSCFEKGIQAEEDMKAFFESNDIPIDLTQKTLVNAEFEMMRDVGTVMKSFKECKFYLTIDDNLLVVDGNEDGTVKEAKYCMCIENLAIVPRKEPGLYDVIEKDGGTFGNLKILISEQDQQKIDSLMVKLKLKKDPNESPDAKAQEAQEEQNN